MTNKTVPIESVAESKSLNLGSSIQRARDSGAILVAVYAAMLVYFSLASDSFLTSNNLFNIAAAVSTLGIVAAAQTAVLISGGFDLSVGSTAAVSSVVAATVLGSTRSAVLAVLAALAFGAAVGLTNGLLITRFKVNALIATLAMLSIVRGVGFVWTNARTKVYDTDLFEFFGRKRLFDNRVPISVLYMLLAFVLIWLLLRYTVFGRFVYAVGGNERAAYLAAIPVVRVRIVLYMVSGMAAGLAGLVIASQLIAGSPQAASSLELQSITAAVLGGASLAGGLGRVWMTLVGVLVMGTLTNGLVLLDISSFWQMVATGVVLILAVALDQVDFAKAKA